jgi:3-oxoadipate enol-lactonase/4-carboxymuconolactone decarboxylase
MRSGASRTVRVIVLELAVSSLAADNGQRCLLVVGPSLGTSVTDLWSACAERLADRFEVIGWDLPGHGLSRPADAPFSVVDLADAVRALVRDASLGRPCWYAGVSLGGLVGLELARQPVPFEAVAVIASAAKIGAAEQWRERARSVRQVGTSVVDAAAQRWFAPGFVEREAEVATRLLSALSGLDSTSYAAACEAIADCDLRPRLAEMSRPLLLVAGGQDQALPLSEVQYVASNAPGGRLSILERCGHLPPGEDPKGTAEVLLDFFIGSPPAAGGSTVRREVLGDDHVDAAEAGRNSFTADFQDLITRYAWGEIWTRPGLDRLTRSAITITALVALGHWGELDLHVRAARRNGMTPDQIGEVLLHSAIYCGVPAANHAFAVAQSVLKEVDGD